MALEWSRVSGLELGVSCLHLVHLGSSTSYYTLISCSVATNSVIPKINLCFTIFLIIGSTNEFVSASLTTYLLKHALVCKLENGLCNTQMFSLGTRIMSRNGRARMMLVLVLDF